MAIAGRSYANVPIIRRGSLEDPEDFKSKTAVVMAVCQTDRRYYNTKQAVVIAAPQAQIYAAAPHPVVIAAVPARIQLAGYPVKVIRNAVAAAATFTGSGAVSAKKPAVHGSAVNGADVPIITAIDGVPGPGWFADQNGDPRLWVATETWAISQRAGEWTSGNWAADYDNFFAARAAQGFTVTMFDPVAGSSSGAPNDNGNTWDGLTPLVGGSFDPSSAGLDSSFWARIDYMFASAAANGITIGLVVYNGDDETGYLRDAWTSTQWTAWGTLLATRYKSTPNLVWLVGNDAFSPFSDTQWIAAMSGISGAGDTHYVAAWYNGETTSRYESDTDTVETWGEANSAFNFCYTYNAAYWLIEYSYLEVADEGETNLLPAVWGDGYFYNGGSGAYYAPTDRFMRQQWWWVLASGGRGVLGESENVYPWGSGALASVTGEWFFANNAANIVSAFTGLTGWNLLIPDTSSALVTGGRGTRVSGLASGGGATAYSGFTNDYVAASITPDKSLAVLYLPNATTITVDQTKLPGSYTATWVDPITGATSSATPGSTYNSTAKGNNSAGDPDWVLVFQANTSFTATGSATGVKPKASGTGTEVFTSTGSSAAVKPAASGTGTEVFTSTGSSAAVKPAASGTGSVGGGPASGTGSASATKAVTAGTGTELFTGSGSSSAVKPAASGSGAYASDAGTGAASAVKPAASGIGSVSFAGTASLVLMKVIPAGNGGESFTGTGSVNVKKPVAFGFTPTFGSVAIGHGTVADVSVGGRNS